MKGTAAYMISPKDSPENSPVSLKIFSLLHNCNSDVKQVSAIVFLCVLLLLLFNSGINVLFDNYEETYSAEKDSAYQAQYTKYYDRAEKKNHVSNEISISINELEEIADLEVLTVSDTECITQNADKSNGNVTSWVKASGTGTYTVNLKDAEYVVDAGRSYVLIRLPSLEIKNIRLDQLEDILFKKEGIGNGNFKEGVAQNMHEEEYALQAITASIEANQYFYEYAENAAISTIKRLVTQLNPDVPDLTVEVEFY